MATFVPPTDDLHALADYRDVRYWDRGYRSAFELFKFYEPLPRGRNVYKLVDGSYVESQPADEATVDVVYLGAHSHRLTAAEYVSLVAAGYGEFISADTLTAVGSGSGSSASSATGVGFTVFDASADGFGVGSSTSSGVGFSVLTASATGSGTGASTSTGSGPFSPISLSPLLWLDASDASTITSSGGAVSQWDDKSGNGYDVTQGTASNQPATGATTINSLNVLDFDGNDYLNGTATAMGSADRTIFVVVDSNNTSGWYFTFGQSGVSGERFGLTGQIAVRVNSGYVIYTTAIPLSPTILAFTSTDGTIQNVECRVNGAALSVGSTASRTLATAAQVQVGADGGTGYGFNGSIAEIIVVQDTLTATEISDTETYLADKWGITL